MKILVTGGAGYIGSHTCIELLNANHEIVIIDNLSNSSGEAVNRICEISEREVDFYRIDILDKDALEAVFANHNFDAVIHFAALKAVGESVDKPLLYYHNNITGSIFLCEVMKKYNVKNIVFSSSATVYGNPASVPIDENFPVSTTNPYGTTKLVIETILKDVYHADNSWNVVILRYFNPIGAHESGKIGEDPKGIPNNLMPYISQVAIGKLKEVLVFGNDYPTSDGTGVRDYIHVVDLARGHLAALEKISENPGEVTYNLGTGNGYSVLEMIAAFEKASGCKVPYNISGRRQGDIAECWADPAKAEKELNWKAELNLEDMCIDTWHWQRQNPNGYKVVDDS